ncbi:hypothetical protein, partial [Xanthomonas oryzae]|uniref:hypothetical protein n=1 Tax=Xanthomonas oryzae TaxID=347 RepID=UPI001C49D685
LLVVWWSCSNEGVLSDGLVGCVERSGLRLRVPRPRWCVMLGVGTLTPNTRLLQQLAISG